jgi:alpha-1,6-mannosyltransferase
MLVTLDISPYTHGPQMLAGPLREAVDPMWMQTPAPYGPLPLAYGGAVADLTASPWLLVVAHRVLALAGLALLAWAVPRLARWSGVNPALASALVLVSPFMIANGVAGLHNDLLMVGLMAAALVVAAERGWFWGAALAGLAAAVKAPGGLVCLGIVLVSLPAGARVLDRLRRAGGVAAAALGVLLGLGVATGLGAGWLAALTVPAAVSTPLSVTDELPGVLRLAGVVGATALGGWLLVARPTGRRDVAVRAVAATVLVFVVLSPVVHLWYFLWAVPFVAVRPLSRGAMTAVVSLSVVGGLVAPLDSSLHGAYVVIVFGVMLTVALTVLLLLTRTSRDGLDRIAAPTTT